MVTPVKFHAGGKSPQKKKNEVIPSSSPLQNDQVVDNNNGKDMSKKEKEQTTTTQQPIILHGSKSFSWIHSGLHKKQSPLSIKNWIATVLTLDGRDKFTKVMQYSSRLLCWYFAGLAARSAVGAGAVTNVVNKEKQFYQALSSRFNSLYKSLVTSRKAFRMGRSVIEWDKLKSMGWGDYLGYLLCHPLEEGGANVALEKEEDNDCVDDLEGHCHSLARYDTHPIPEEEEEDEKSWSGDENCAAVEEKKDDAAVAHGPLSEKSKKIVSRPGRPVLPSRISSNIGWGPSNTTAVNEDTSSSPSKSQHAPPPRTVSEMGRQMYRPYPTESSTSLGSYKQLKETSTLTKTPPSSPPTPAWKLIGGTLKLLGLMGFWAFDNLSFLTSSGFLDPIQNDAKSNATIRTIRKQSASENAARCYFVGCLAGLYVNLKSFWIHRNGALADARRKCYNDISASNGKEEDDDGARRALKQTEQKHFELFLALLKSVCDVTVFSNNPGIDLHLKLRGKKNHEGLHCLCGLISASTVLYNNFPNAE